jgi:hypothetical protein
LWKEKDSRAPRPPGCLRWFLGEKAEPDEARLACKPPTSFELLNVFSVFVNIKNPQPSASFLFCCGRGYQARVEWGGGPVIGFLLGSGGTGYVGYRDSVPFALRLGIGFPDGSALSWFPGEGLGAHP